jgi:hypothetical protein
VIEQLGHAVTHGQAKEGLEQVGQR